MAGGHYAAQAAPGRMWVAVTPHDTTNLPSGCRGLYVGTVGVVALVGADDHVENFTVSVANSFFPLGPKRVNSTDTTSTGIIAIY